MTAKMANVHDSPIMSISVANSRVTTRLKKKFATTATEMALPLVFQNVHTKKTNSVSKYFNRSAADTACIVALKPQSVGFENNTTD